jgi:hypothetical protein
MFRIMIAIATFTITSTLGADAGAREPGALDPVARESQPPSNLFTYSDAPVFVTSTLPDLHLSTPGKLASSPTLVTPFTAGAYTVGKLPLTDVLSSESKTAAYGLRVNDRANPARLLVSALADPAGPPTVTAIVLPSLPRDASTLLAAPAFSLPSGQFLDNGHPMVGR